MNDEIKEKVDMTIRKVRVAMIKHREGFYDYDMLVCHELDYNEWKNLLDYITNLQNEIDILKDQVEWWKQQCDDLEMQVSNNE